MDLASGVIKDVVKGMKSVLHRDGLFCLFICQAGTVINLSSPWRISEDFGGLWTDDPGEVIPFEADAITLVAAAGWH